MKAGKLLWLALLCAGSAFAQQNTDISGVDFSTGKADAALAALGRAAAASGSRLVITAPADWHKQIAAKVRAGGKAEVVLRDGFYENVLVRIEDQSAQPAEAEAPSRAEADKSRAEADKARADAAKSRAEADKAQAEAEKFKAEAERAKAEAELAKVRAQQAAQQVAAPAASAAPSLVALPANTAAASPASEVDRVRSRFEKSLLGGRSADGDLAVGALQAGDTIYVDGPVRAVVRREGLRAVLFWLDGDLDLRRAELKVMAENRYQVVAAIRGDSGALRSEFDNTPPLAASVPADGAAVRSALEQSFNEGRRIDERLPVAKLRNGDIVYAGEGAAVVVRREGKNLLRFWLEGSLDLRQSAVHADGANRYRVVGTALR